LTLAVVGHSVGPEVFMPAQVRRHRPAGLRAARLPQRSPLHAAVALVSDDLARAEQALAAALQSTVPAVSEIGQYLASAGGKRLRPLLTALGARAIGVQGDLTPLLNAGEILHLGSLLHDDVVDGGLERRGKPAAHTVYGNAGAVLTGDFCLARAVLLAAEGGGEAAVVELSRVVTRMAEGEVTQLLHAGAVELPLDVYFDIIEAKSAALISWCAQAGALASGDTRAAPALAAYGRAVGIAFQISDDVLDYRGSLEATGKRPGVDLLEGKLTLPLLLAVERSGALRQRLRAGPVTEGELDGLLATVVATGACEDALLVARARVTDGLKALAVLPPSAYRDALERLAWFLVERVQ
jgi:octaprenyl-diphosphate synthase